MLISNVRLAFPALFKAKAFSADKPPKFGATFILGKQDPQVQAIQAALYQAATDKWGGRAEQILRELWAGGRVCLQDGAAKAKYDGFDDTVYIIRASTDRRPGVYDRNQAPLVEGDGRPYAGCYVNAIVTFWAQDNQWGKRINGSLEGVQFTADGEPFGGGQAAAAEDFPALEDEVPGEQSWGAPLPAAGPPVATPAAPGFPAPQGSSGAPPGFPPANGGSFLD